MVSIARLPLMLCSLTIYTAMSAPAPVYCGPTCSLSSLSGVIASIPLEGSGLRLEVADSIVAKGAGKGLFIRCEEGVESVTVAGATALCGYAQGMMESVADSDGGKTVAFALRTPGTAVFFEQGLHTVESLLGSGLTIAGHTGIASGDAGSLERIEVDEDYAGARYFVPVQPQPELSVMNIGQFANDLAIGEEGASEAYSDTSSLSNLLVLVQRLERSPTDANLLLPSRPISTLARDVTFENEQPMELGCEYGERYWYAKEAAEA